MKNHLFSLLVLLAMTTIMPANVSAAMRHKAPAANAELTASSFGFLDGPDGMTWHFTQQYTGDMYQYNSSVVTVYDSKRELQGSFTVDIPNTMRVNQIEPFGLITSKLFDNKANTKEVLVYLHEVGNESNGYKGTDHLYVYNLNGEKVAEFIGDGMIVDASPNEWTTWQRLIIASDNADGKHTDVCIYRTPSWGEDTAVLDKTIQLDKNNISYTDGPFMNFFNVDGNPYFVLCHYEKPFVEYDDDGHQIMDETTFMPYFTENNRFIIDTYDKSYNLVSSFGVPTNAKSEDYLVRMNSFGVFSNQDLSRGYFSGDNKLNYIVMNEDVTITTEYVLSFDVYDQDGKFIRTIADNVGDNYKRLTDIEGMEEQWIFLDANGASLFAVDLPSCTRKEIPTQIGDYSISFNIDRVASSNNEGYNYIMGVNEAKTNETGTDVIAMFAYLKPDFSVDHFVDVNMGPLAQTFTPLISEEGLDPYLFNTDDNREYLFFSKVKDNNNGTNAHNVLFVANDEGRIIESFNLEAGNKKGDIWTAMILNYGKSNPCLFINYYDWDNDRNTMEFYDLPLTSFAKGGDGSEENPYLISSVGDIAQIAKHPGAAYKVANDFDAHDYKVSVPEFSGIFDGDGHTIRNLNVTSDNYYGGLFGNTTGATIKDLTLFYPKATLTSKNEQFGLISGFAIETKISGLGVHFAEVKGEGYGTTPVGMIVGMATATTNISNCHVSQSTMTTGSNTVGGICGEMRTGSIVERCAVSDCDLTARNELGGIAGIIGNGCSVTDCTSNANLSAGSFVGGIAGRCGVSGTRGNITRSIFSGTINSPRITNDPASLTTNSIGGIAGIIEPDWTKTETGMVSSCAVYDATITTPDVTDVILPIAGRTIIDEDETRTETGLANNYVVSDATAALVGIGEKVSIDTAMPQTFWTNIGYLFGTDDTAPWQMSADSHPHLYFDTLVVDGITQPSASVSHKKNDNRFFNLQGQLVGKEAKGIIITNGKKKLKK